jgi:DNA polymerase phi
VLCLALCLRIEKVQEGEVEDDDGAVKTLGRPWRPQVHHVWDELLEEVLPPESSGRSPKGSFQEFFRIVVDGG